jgi:hypothetical protein
MKILWKTPSTLETMRDKLDIRDLGSYTKYRIDDSTINLTLDANFIITTCEHDSMMT